MKRALTWLAGLAGIAALLRRRSPQKGAAPQTATQRVPSPDPADELRQKLDETRAADPSSGADSETPASLDERRARVHERAQEAIDLMHGSDDNPPAS